MFLYSGRQNVQLQYPMYIPCDKVQFLPASSTERSDRRDKTKILLNVVLITLLQVTIYNYTKCLLLVKTSTYSLNALTYDVQYPFYIWWHNVITISDVLSFGDIM